MSIPACADGEEPVAMVPGTLFWSLDSDLPRIKKSDGTFDTLAAGGTVPTLDPITFSMRPDSGATPLTGVSPEDAAAAAAYAWHARLGYLSLEDFGAVGDGTTDDTAAVNLAFKTAIAQKIELRAPAGKKYRLTDTVYVGPDPLGTSAFASFNFTGAHAGYDPDYAPNVDGIGAMCGCHFISEVTDKPAFAFQSIRNGRFSHCSVVGGMPGKAGNPSFFEADYVGSYSVDRYAPHAGVAIDPYSGSTPPGGGYPGATYVGAIGSYQIHFDHVRVLNFVVGVAVQPANFDGNASSVTVDHGEITDCCYGVSVGGSQNRNCALNNTSLNRCMEAITNVRHGARFGSIPKIRIGEWTTCARLFNVSSSVDSLDVHGLYCEGTRSIGVIGQQFSQPCGASFTGCLFGLEASPTAACILDIGMPCTFMGCTIGVDDCAFGIVVRGPQPLFKNCLLFSASGGDGWAWFPAQNPTQVPIFEGCVVSSPAGPKGVLASTLQIGVNRESDTTTAALVSNKRVNYLPTSRVIRTEQNVFDLKPPVDVVGWAATPVVRAYYVPAPTAGSYAFTASTCIFTATHGYHFLTGDVLLYPMLAVSANVAVELPALRVTGVVGNVVTCDLLFDRDEYDETSTAATIKILPVFWTPNPLSAPLIGAIVSGSATVNFSGLDPRDYMIVGDFVLQRRDTAMVSIYRITALSATTATLSSVAGGSSLGAGFPLMFGEMSRAGGAFTMTFTSADLIAARYLILPHGRMANLAAVQIFDNTGLPFTTAVVGPSSNRTGILDLDLGAVPPAVVGTWTVVGCLIETET